MKKLILCLFIIASMGLGHSAYAQCGGFNPANGVFAMPLTPGCNTDAVSTTVSPWSGWTFDVYEGSTYNFNTCASGGSTWDTQITLFDNSTGLYAGGYNDDGCSLQSNVTWVANFSGTVRIVVHRYNCNEIAAYGYFPGMTSATLTVRETLPPVNNTCAGAASVAIGGSVSGDTRGRCTLNEALSCGTPAGSGGVLWYTFTGNGNKVRAEIPSGSYDTKIWVYSDCSYTCVGGNDDGGAGLLSLLDFCTIAGQEYKIAVGGFGSGEGTFNLSLTDIGNNLFAGIIDNPQTICSGAVPSTITNLSDATSDCGPIVYQWQVSTTSGVAGFSDILGAMAADYAPPALTSTTWYRRVATVGTESLNSNAIEITVNPCGLVTWLGNSDDDDDPLNWSNGIVPTCSESILIPVTANNPTFDGLFECNDIEVAASVSPTITLTSTLGVCGDVILTDGSSIVGAGMMSLNGTNGGFNFTGAINPSVENLSLTSNYIFTGNVNITNSLVLNGGDIDATGGTITLKSSATSTAYFDDFTNPGNTFTGNLEQERFITTGVVGGVAFGQRLFGSAVSSGSITGLNPSYAGYPTGQIIPLSTCDPNGLDASSPYSNLFEWNEDATFLFGCYQSGWTALNASSAALTPGRGYSGWMDAGSTISVTGTPNTGAVSYGALSNTNGVVDADGWHVLSNPYPSPMNIDAVTDDGFTSPQYYDNSTAFSGTYQPVVASGGVVPIMQGFVANTVGANTFSPSNTDRIASNDPNYAKSNKWFDYKLEVEVEVNGNKDITYLYYSGNTSDQFDIEGDCVKRKSDASKPTLFSRMNGEELSLNGLHLGDLGTSIPMGLIAPEVATYQFSFAGMSTFPANTDIYLEDLTTGTFHNVNTGTYTFTADPADNGTDRFMIHYVLPASFSVVEPSCDNVNASIIENTNDGRITVIINDGVQVASGTLDGSVNDLVAGDYTIQVIDAYGGSQFYDFMIEAITTVDATILASQTVIEVGESIDFDFDGLGATNFDWFVNSQLVAQTEMFNYVFDQAGVYVIELDATNNDCVAHSSQEVTVSEKTTSIMEVGEFGSLNIFALDGNVFLDFKNVNQGMVEVGIYNLLGQEMLVTAVESTGRQTITNRNWATGYYIVKVRVADKNLNQTVLITK